MGNQLIPSRLLAGNKYRYSAVFNRLFTAIFFRLIPGVPLLAIVSKEN